MKVQRHIYLNPENQINPENPDSDNKKALPFLAGPNF
jgi:hypothetical protein